MNYSIHYVSGFFEHLQQEDAVFTKPIAQRLPSERVQIYKHHSPEIAHEPIEGNN